MSRLERMVGSIVLVSLVFGLGAYFVTSSHKIETEKETGIGLPQQVIIPSIGVNTSVEHLGLTALGAMDSPDGPDNVAWYSLGPRPGDEGSAVLAGHRSWKDSMPAVFDHLEDIEIGDKIEIVDNEGNSTFFIVIGSQVFNAEADTASVFNSVGGKYLNLITCVGDWDVVAKTSSQRLVVFAKKVE